MRRAITLNFWFAVSLSILGGIALIRDMDLVIPYSEGLYGALRNNLFIVVGYLLISQSVLWFFRYRREGRNEALLMGLIFLLTAGGTEFYAILNDLPISEIFILALVYLGLSHILYFFVAPITKRSPTEYGPETKKREFWLQ